MKLHPLQSPFVLVATLGAALVVGCSDDPVAPAADAGTDAADASTDTFVENCENVAVAESSGEVCDSFNRCAAGAQCSRLDAGTESGVCRQLCVPGQCESICGSDQACAPLTASPGTGVCADRLTGDRGVFEACSDALGYCTADLDCVIGAGSPNEGVCLPECADMAECEAVRAGSQCVIQSGSTDYCAPPCSAAGANDECPDSMACFVSGAGHVCAFPPAG